MADRSQKIHLVFRYLEGELSLPERQVVEVHLRICAVCRQELTLLRQIVDALQELPLEITPVDFMEKLNRRIEQEAGLRRRDQQKALSHTLTVGGSSAPQALLPLSELGDPPRTLLAWSVHHWWRSLCFPL